MTRSPMTKPLAAPLSFCLFLMLTFAPALAQIPPGAAELAAYQGLHAAAAKGDVAAIDRLAASGAPIDARDGQGRTPLHVAAFMQQQGAARALLRHKADPNALEAQQYDIVTIAAVADDVPMLKLALEGGGSAKNITSPYVGTALIAAAHLGHDEVVRTLIAAHAPLDHINNLGWTALIESIVLGNGGKRHVACLEALVEAGADVNIADRAGATPLALASGRGYAEMVAILEKAGAR
jgi:ankyrin repeat protein